MKFRLLFFCCVIISTFVYFLPTRLFAWSGTYTNCFNGLGYCADTPNGSCYSTENGYFPIQQQQCPAGTYLYQDPNGNNCIGDSSQPLFCGAVECGNICQFHGTCCMPINQTCANSVGGFCAPNARTGCGQGYTYYSNPFECGVGCCVPQTCSNMASGACSGSRGCFGGTVPDSNSYECSFACCVSPGSIPNCDGGLSCPNWPACGGYPANTCSTNNGSQNRTCQYTTYNGSNNCVIQNIPQSQGCTVDNCSANYACHNGLCETNIHIFVYTDYNHDEVKNGTDAGKQGVTVTDNGGNFPTTDANGEITFTNKVTGTTNFTMTTPADFLAIGPTSQQVTLTNNAGDVTANFYVTPLYQIKGNVFNDNNKNGKDDAGVDSGYGGGGTITVTGGPTTVNPITVAGDGTWSTPGNLAAGNYTVTYTTALPTGYTYTTNSAWSVTVGDPAGGPQAPVCNKSSSPDAVCGGQNNGSISNLNIGVTNENTHSQVACLDFRVDNNGGGTVEDQFPGPGATCGGVNGSNAIISNGTCSTGAGIVYSCNGTFDFGLGSSNANDWQAGGTTQECFSPPGLNNIRTSYDFLLATAQQSGITPIDMSDPSVCGAGGIADCILDSNLPKGVYIANGNVTLNNATNLPAPADPNNDYSAYIFLINGNLEINNNILIPQGSTALFSAKGNIDVGSGVGQDASNTTLASVNNPNLEGIYSADNTFTVHSVSETNGGQVCSADGSPLDLKLNIVGAVIDNAGQTGGQFVNNRDLCTSDLECPSVSTGDGLNYLLTLIADGQFVLHKNFNWNEVKP